MLSLLNYFEHLHSYLTNVEITIKHGILHPSLEFSQEVFLKTIKEVQENDKKLIFIGNGGSAAIASHMALDYSKAGGIRAIALNDPVALTAISNDMGYNEVFAEQISYYGNEKDVLIAISSSGQSMNILMAVDYAVHAKGMSVITFSGFKADNPLREKGFLNFYVPSVSYGFVELSHQVLLHAFLDIYTGVFK